MNQVDTAIYSKLTGTGGPSVNGVYHGVAPKDVTFPIIVFQEITGSDRYTMTKRATKELLYQIMVVAQGASAQAAGDAMDTVDGLLHDTPLTVTGYSTLYVRRAASREFVTVEGGQMYWHVVSDYRIMVTPT